MAVIRMNCPVLVACALACCVASGVCRGQETTPADQKYSAALLKAAMEYDEALVAARTEYLAALKEQMTEATKSGDLDAAVVLRDKVKKLEAQAKDGPSILRKLAGTNWVNTNGVAFQWKEDGTFYHAGKERPCFPVDARRVAIVFGSSHIDVLQFDENLAVFEQFSTKGNVKPIMTGKRAILK